MMEISGQPKQQATLMLWYQDKGSLDHKRRVMIQIKVLQ
jgi:hypothetical protein